LYLIAQLYFTANFHCAVVSKAVTKMLTYLYIFLLYIILSLIFHLCIFPAYFNLQPIFFRLKLREDMKEHFPD